MEERRYSWQATGLTPLVMNNLDAAMAAQATGLRDPDAYWKDHYLDLCYKNDSGIYEIPIKMLRASLLETPRFLTIKPRGQRGVGWYKYFESVVQWELGAVIDVEAKRIFGWRAYVSSNGKKGGPKVPKTRPVFPLPWKAATIISVFDYLVTADVLQAACDAQGRKCGMGDARKLGYGRADIEVLAI